MIVVVVGMVVVVVVVIEVEVGKTVMIICVISTKYTGKDGGKSMIVWCLMTSWRGEKTL